MGIINVLTKPLQMIRACRREQFLKTQREKLKNKNISVIASNCNGAMILHDLKLPFNSPFVNLWIKPHDYVKMCRSLKHYMESELVFIEQDEYDYPVALLDDIHIYFQHYQTEEEAGEKWQERVKRIDYDHLYFLFTDRDGCTEEDLTAFDRLPYEHKAVFVNRPHENIKSAVYISGFENEACVGFCMYYRNLFSYRKYYDDFDYVGWVNNQ